MKNISSKFQLIILLTTVVCAVLQWLWNANAPQHLHLRSGFLLLGFFSFSVTALHSFLMRAAKGNTQAFVNKYMATTVFKFMLYLLLLIILLLYSDENKRAIILHFLFYYALFTVIEVGFLYKQLQELKK